MRPSVVGLVRVCSLLGGTSVAIELRARRRTDVLTNLLVLIHWHSMVCKPVGALTYVVAPP